MWRPLERIKHPLPDGGWPTRQDAASAPLFQPIRLGPIELAERTWVPAMVPWRATEDGFVTPEVLQWYGRLAQGQPGALVVEATGVRDVPSGPLLRVGHERFVPGLSELVQTVKRASNGRTRLLLQLIDFVSIRRRPERQTYFDRYSGGRRTEDELTDRQRSDLAMGYRERIWDTDLPHIRELPRVLPGVFAAAAARSEAAGFDGVELHYAHAYTMASFLSALNRRDDGYGGDQKGRIRLPLEVLAAVRSRVSPTFAVGLRFLAEECIDGGYGVEDAAWFGARFAQAGTDFVSLSRGGKFEDARQPKVGAAAYPYTGPSGYECMPTAISDARGPFGRNVEAATAVRRAIREIGPVPVVVAGGICSYVQAANILETGAADVIGAARQSLADPDWFRKMRLGRGAEIRRCTYTNYCEGLDQKHKQVTCKLWDRQALDDGEATLSHDGKRRLAAPDWAP